MSFTRDELRIERERPYYDDYPEFTFPIQDFHDINVRADAIRKAKGLMPMFDFESEHDEDGWYDFEIECMWQDNDISGIELWFRVENGACDDNQCSYKIGLEPEEIKEIHDWLMSNEETSEFIKDTVQMEEKA